ncbi:MAG: protein kinase, partial [Candidatus Cloacimonadota bacterium]|nr:protein kinase [Candidatus Cloacimonadota bacterium]
MNKQENKFEKQTSSNNFKTQVRGKSSSYGAVNLENLPAGYIVDERYEVKAKIGQGGFGAVYRAYDKKMNIDKALKVIPEAIVHDEEAMVDLRQEASTMISLNHNSIVRVYDFHDTGAIKYIDMEFVDGKTLTKYKLEHPNKQIPEAKVKELAVKIAVGLAYAHSKGIIHKDVKPQNVMLTKDGDVKIMDFGIAETVRTSMSRIQNTSSSGTLVYMSPEQIKGKDVGKESDIYSFGAMLYELLSGHPPFYKGAIEHQILNEKPEALDFISVNLNKLIMRCLEKDYKDRFGNFNEVEEFLEADTKKVELNSEDGRRKTKKTDQRTDVASKQRSKRDLKSDENGKKEQKLEEDVDKPDEQKDAPEQSGKPKKKSGAFKIILIFLLIGFVAGGVLLINDYQEKKRQNIIQQRELEARQERIANLLEKADNYYANGDLSSAEEKYEAVLELEANNYKAVRGIEKVENKRKEIVKSRSNKAPEGMVFVQGGTFQMGSNDYIDEQPVHTVTVGENAHSR